MSWAIPGQGGHGHVNERKNEEVVEVSLNIIKNKNKVCTTNYKFSHQRVELVGENMIGRRQFNTNGS